MEKMEARSRDHSLLLVNVCLDYSGKWDIAQSCMKIMHKHHMDSILDEGGLGDSRIESIMEGMPHCKSVVRRDRGESGNGRLSGGCAHPNGRGAQSEQFPSLADRLCGTLRGGRLLAGLDV